jgi:hypothetical protein
LFVLEGEVQIDDAGMLHSSHRLQLSEDHGDATLMFYQFTLYRTILHIR